MSDIRGSILTHPRLLHQPLFFDVILDRKAIAASGRGSSEDPRIRKDDRLKIVSAGGSGNLTKTLVGCYYHYMRIGFFTDSYLPRLDGIAISVETFREHLEELGHEVYIFCPHRPEPFQEPSPRVYRFKSTPSVLYDEYRNTFPFSRKHYKAISQLGLDIVHIHTPMQIGILGHIIASRNHLPLVTTCHSDPGLFKDYKWLKYVFTLTVGVTTLLAPRDAHKRRLANPLSFNSTVRAYMDQFDLIIAPSTKIQKSLKLFGIHARIEIVPTGFDVNALPVDGRRGAQRQKLGLNDDHIAIISTSRLVQEKRIDFLLYCFAIACRDHPNYVFLIVGDGPKKKELIRLAQKLGISSQIKFLGKLERKELVATLQAADVLVNASLRETQGLVFNEAAAVGLPVIALEEDINPILQHQSTALIPANTVESYAHAVQELASSTTKRHEFGKRALGLARLYGSSNQAKKLEKLYTELLSR